MSHVIKKLMKAARHFTPIDFGLFKLCLVLIGILIGTYFGAYFQSYITIISIVTGIVWLILIVQIIRYLREKE